MDKQKKYAVYQKVIAKNHLTEKKLKVYSTIFLIIAIIAFLIGLPTIAFGGIIFIIVGLVNLYISVLYRNCAKFCFKNGVPVQLDNLCTEIAPGANTNTVYPPSKTETPIDVKVSNAPNADETVSPNPVVLVDAKAPNIQNADETVSPNPVVLTDVKVPTPANLKSVENTSVKYKTENHHIAGISYYEDAVLSLAIDNPDYDYTKNELVDFDMIDERVYQYTFPVSKVELIEDPDNQHDPNAIKVLADGVQIGYIKRGSCSHIKNLIRNNKIKTIHAFIGGGKYKCIEENYDYEKDKEVYTLERGTTHYFCEITLDLYE